MLTNVLSPDGKKALSGSALCAAPNASCTAGVVGRFSGSFQTQRVTDVWNGIQPSFAFGPATANTNQVSDSLRAANPRNSPDASVPAMMKTHLDQTLSEAVDPLTGHHQTGIREYDAIERHIIEMADTLSGGIVKQFPSRFR